MQIKESLNDKYKITPIKMANDQIIDGVYPPLPNYYSFFILLIGRPNSGKSTLLLNLINKRASNTYYKKFHKVHIFSNSLKTITQKIKLPDDQLHDGIDQLEEVVEDVRNSDNDDTTLIVIDDCITDLKDTTYMQKLIFNRRHIGGGISLIITTQVYNKLALCLRKCATDMILFSTSNKRELDSIFNDYSLLTKEEFQQICKYAFQNSHEFLWYSSVDETYYHNFNRLTIETEK